MRCWLIKRRSNCMMTLEWQMGRRPPGRSRAGRIRTTKRQGSSIGEEGQLRARAEVTIMGRKGGNTARSRTRTPVGTSGPITGRLTEHTKVERGTRPASTTGLEAKRRVATIERRNRNQLEEANSIRTKIQMLRSRDQASTGSLEKNSMFLVLPHGAASCLLASAYCF